MNRLPPQPLPKQLWGDRWRFAALPASELVETFQARSIPIVEMPDSLLPLNLGLASTVAVPGVVVDGGRQSMKLARWLQEVVPVTLNYISGPPDGLVLEAGVTDSPTETLCERWIIATFEDAEVQTAGQLYQARKRLSQGLHFLLVQPDDSGATYSGFWLLLSTSQS